MPHERPKATHSGKLFDGLLDCYVLDNERRVVSQRGVLAALTGGAETGNIARYTSKLPKRFAVLAAGPEIEIGLPGGGVAKARDAQWVVDLLKAYDEADDADELHHTQRHLAKNARRILRALAGVGIVALIDEATNYQAVREAQALSFTFRAILMESTREWDLMWPSDFVEAICALHREPFTGAQPRFLASTYDKLYRLILGTDVVDELKRRNPDPKFGSNHHQWLTPEAREVLRKQIPIVTVLAEQCGTKEEFWARIEHRYAKRPLQLSWEAPRRAS